MIKIEFEYRNNNFRSPWSYLIETDLLEPFVRPPVELFGAGSDLSALMEKAQDSVAELNQWYWNKHQIPLF